MIRYWNGNIKNGFIFLEDVIEKKGWAISTLIYNEYILIHSLHIVAYL